MRISDWSSDVCSSDLVVGGGVAGDELHLRNVAAPVHAVDQRRQRRHRHADRGDHGMAFGQVGDEARIALAEADQVLALLFHTAPREATLGAIAPGDVRQWWKKVVRGNVAEALKVIEQYALIGQDLLRLDQVLQGAAAAGAEVRAARDN